MHRWHFDSLAACFLRVRLLRAARDAHFSHVASPLRAGSKKQIEHLPSNFACSRRSLGVNTLLALSVLAV
jgi:hypothetical protein